MSKFNINIENSNIGSLAVGEKANATNLSNKIYYILVIPPNEDEKLNHKLINNFAKYADKFETFSLNSLIKKLLYEMLNSGELQNHDEELIEFYIAERLNENPIKYIVKNTVTISVSSPK